MDKGIDCYCYYQLLHVMIKFHWHHNMFCVMLCLFRFVTMNNINLEQDFNCVICHDLAKDPTVTTCCHGLFCRTCLAEALVYQPNVCPLCRGTVRSERSTIMKRLINSFQEGRYRTSFPREPVIEMTSASYRTYTCKHKGCNFSGVDVDYVNHYAREHVDFILDDAVDIPCEHIFRIRNDEGRPCIMGDIGKFYCSDQVAGLIPHSNFECCRCRRFCDNRLVCGPHQGCNCRSCMRLDVQMRHLKESDLVNRSGRNSFFDEVSQTYSCGMSFKSRMLGRRIKCSPYSELCFACCALNHQYGGDKNKNAQL